MSDVSVRFTIQDDASSKLTKISSTAKTASTQLQQMGKQIDSALNASSASRFASELGNAMNDAEEDVESVGDAVENLGSSLESMDALDDISRAAEDAGESLEDMTDQADKLGESVDSIGDADSGLDDLGREADSAGTSIENAESKAINLTSTLKTLFAAVSGAAVLKSVGSYVSDSIDTGTDYSSMISEVQAISGADSAEMAELEATAREYGATTVFSASESAEALKYMSLAGWSASESTSALGGVLDLAAASGLGLGEASDMVTDYLSAFGMEADQATYFADMLTYAQANSNTTVAQLSEAYQNSAANMNAYGQDVETTTSLLEAMANQGYKGAKAGTSLAAMMRDITNNMEDGAIAIGDTSIAVQDSEGNFRDLTDILADVEEATESMGDAQKAAALSDTFTSDSIKGVNMVLAEGVDTIAEYEEELRNASGTAAEMADIMNDNLAGDKAAMNSAYEELQLQTYEAMEEPLRSAVQYITNTVIPTLTEWVPSAFESVVSSLTKIGNAVAPIFETIIKNPKAISEVFTTLGTAFVAMKGVNTALTIGNKVSEAGGLVNALNSLSSSMFGSSWALGAAAIAAAVVVVKNAVDDYNDLQVDTNLEQHFGEISLDTSEVEALAGEIVPVDITADLQLASVKFEEAEELIEEAEELLEENQYINWKVKSINVLTDEDADTLISNTDTFVTDVTTALEKEEYAAELTVTALMGEVDSTGIISKMSEWFNEDYTAVETLGNAVTDLLQKSIDDGAYNVETATAIEIMQQKMLELANGTKKAEMEGSLKWLSLSSSGAALDSESWAEVVETVGEYQTELVEADKESYEQLFSYLSLLEANDPTRADEIKSIEDAIAEAYKQTSNTALTSGWEWIYNSMTDAYGDELNAAQDSLSESTASFFETFQKNMQEATANGSDVSQTLDNLMTFAFTNVDSGLDDSTKGALLDRYETMLPTVDELKNVIDSAYDADTGEQIAEIPTAIMDAYNQALQIGAAAGDTDALYEYAAQQIAASYGSKEELLADLESYGVDFSQYPEAFQEGINRAFTETSDELDYAGFAESLVESMSGEDVDWSQVEAILAEYGLTFETSLSEIAENVENTTDDIVKAMQIDGLTATGNQDANGNWEYTVDTGNTLSSIAEATGVTLEALEAANQQIYDAYGSWDLIYPGDIIYVPDVDTSEVGEAMDEAASEAQEAADEATAEPITTEQEYEYETTATTTVETTAEEGEDNFDETAGSLSNSFQSAVDLAFDKTFTTTTAVSITANYTLANPSATVTFSDGGTGTATVTSVISAHALGGIFDTPHIGMVAEDGPEAIIPLNGSDDALALWEQAGEQLGVVSPSGGGGLAVDTKPETGSASGGSGNSERTINLNINGNGSIKVSGSGASKEEIVDVMVENFREVFMQIVEEEIIEEGDGTYDW